MFMLYIIMGFIVASLFLLEIFVEDSYIDAEVMCCFAFFALLIGLIWPLAIWVMAIKWIAADETPKWITKVKTLINHFRK